MNGGGTPVSKATHSNWGIQKIVDEINKTMPLCCVCHRKVHAGDIILKNPEQYLFNVTFDEFNEIYQNLFNRNDKERQECEKLR